ncbi:MAG TPA: ice-binding family protein [Candidatus Sulfotelmatobacter sp.]|nr:ice-binding family protein [Candidatus Sulfotelmatobacter sp.]
MLFRQIIPASVFVSIIIGAGRNPAMPGNVLRAVKWPGPRVLPVRKMTSTQSTSKPMMKRTGVIAIVLIAIAVIAGVLVYYVAFRPGTGTCGNSVNLNTAGNFAVLASSAVTSTGATTVTGDLGVSPGTAISGFTGVQSGGPGTLSGTAHSADSAAATAQTDATNAYNAANALTGGTAKNGDIGGQTLTCGLYTATSSISVGTADVTLDAQGNGNNVFIFQISSTLTTSPGRSIILTGGAQAKNIFWIVGSSATIDTTSKFQGTIIAYASVTINQGATMTGRALARTGAVTMNADTITKPS